MSDLPAVPPPLGDWADDAACLHADPDLWFPEKGENGEAAKAICDSCPVAADCHDYATNSPVALNGIWGGVGERRRRELRRHLRIKEAS